MTVEQPPSAPRGPARVRVVIVDDVPDMRRLLRELLERDDRFEVVGEGADGIEAIALSTSLNPDLLLLDRQMPRMGGLEAMPEIERGAPRTNVILFTANASAGTYHAALSAGALDVIEKSADPGFVDRLANTLVDHWAQADAEVRVHIGPVASHAARLWIDSSRRILAALRLHSDVLSEPIPGDVLELFDHFLHTWEEISEGPEDFFWTARAKFSAVSQLIECWARIDGMSEEQAATLGIEWSPSEARPFYHALTEGVLDALEAHAASQELAKALRRQWTPEA